MINKSCEFDPAPEIPDIQDIRDIQNIVTTTNENYLHVDWQSGSNVSSGAIIPHRCPVCNGQCVVVFNFYDIGFGADTTTTTAHSGGPAISTTECRSCEGKGYILI